MIVLIDLNIFIDVFQKGVPHYRHSSVVLTKVLEKKAAGIIAGHSLTTLHYLLSRFSTSSKALEFVDWVLANFEVVSAGKDSFLQARTYDMKDFEDAVVAVCASDGECDYIVTRNLRDFVNSPIPALSPKQFLEKL